MNAIVIAASLGGAVLLLFLFLLSRSLRFSGCSAATLEDLAQIRPSTYQSMARLFDAEDFEFLAMQAGYTPALRRRVERERREILLRYLDQMAKDFQVLHVAATELLLVAPEDMPDLAAALTRQRWEFHLHVVRLRALVYLTAVIGFRAINTRPVVDCFSRQFEGVSALNRVILGTYRG